MKPILFSIVALGAMHGTPQTADACSAPQCWPGAFVPGDGATVPANLPAVTWRPIYDNAASAAGDPANVVLATAAAPELAIPFTASELPGGDYLLVPDAPLEADTAYVLDDGNTCGSEAGPSVAFTTGPAAPLPASLGALAVGTPELKPLQVGTSSGSCSIEVDAVTLALELDAATEAAAWLPALHFETIVDGQPWRASASINLASGPGESWRGRGRDLLYRICASDDPYVTGLAAGSHEVKLRATLPGSTTVLETAPVTIELACPADPPAACVVDPAACEDDIVDSDGGCAAAGGGGSWLLFALGALMVRWRVRATGR